MRSCDGRLRARGTTLGCVPHRTHGSGELRLDAFRRLGRDCVFEAGVLVFHPENIEIGQNVYVGHQTILKGYYKNGFSIGDHTWIGQQCFLHSGGGLTIGANVGIGPGVRILTSKHAETARDVPILAAPLEFAAVVIEEGADLGVSSVILPGVRVGRGAQVGAGAVVSEDVPPYSVVAGVPARVIRERPR
ncbi:MAG: acyltransferase [Polyangiaceae bacterium]|nr:acyltransferase [Polyangiaceae bacterium]